MAAEHALLIPDIIERILSPLDSRSVICMASLTKISREVVRYRGTWLGISRTRDYCCVPEYFSSMPTAHLWLVANDPKHQAHCANGSLSHNAARLVSNADPAEQVLELEYLLSKLQGGCAAFIGPICFIIDSNRHLMSGALQVQAQCLRVLDALVDRQCVPVNEIVFDILMPHLWQYLNNSDILAREPDALLKLACRLLDQHWIIRRYGRELLDNHVVDLFLQHLKQKSNSTDNSWRPLWVRDSTVGICYKSLLAHMFAVVDECILDRLLPQLRDLIDMLGNDHKALGILTESHTEQVWQALLSVTDKRNLHYHQTLQLSLAQMAVKNPRQFWRILLLGTFPDQFLPDIFRSSSVATFCNLLTDGFTECPGWMQIRCIQSLIDASLVTKIVSQAYPNPPIAYKFAYIIAASAGASQEATLAKLGILKPIVAAAAIGSATAKNAIKKLVERRKYVPFVVEYLQNKEIKLY